MKKKLTVFCMGVLVVCVLAGCSLHEFKESTLTLVNDSDSSISSIMLYNGASGASSRISADVNILSDGDVLESGAKMVIGLTPVLHENSFARLVIAVAADRSDVSDPTDYSVYFTYNEGADVIATFDLSQSSVIALENAVSLDD